MLRSFCGVTAQYADKHPETLDAKLGTLTPSWCLQAEIRPFTDAQTRQYLADAFGRWSKVCGVTFRETTDARTANFVILSHDFRDGPAGVLADCQLPWGGQQRMRFDVQTRWVASINPPAGSIDIIAVASHEMGHGLGLEHLPLGGQVDLMEPFYRPGLRDPQAAETALVVRMYGEPKKKAADPPPGPTGKGPRAKIIVTMDGRTWEAEGNLRDAGTQQVVGESAGVDEIIGRLG